MVAHPSPPQAQQTTPQAGNRTALRNQGVLLQAHRRELKLPRVQVELQVHQEDRDLEI